MKSTLLIVTPQASFGVLIRAELDPARYDVFSTADFSDAIHLLRENNIPTVLLDLELEGEALSVMDIGFALRQIKPDVQFILVLVDGQEIDTDLLMPVATLVKPISVPDLSVFLDELVLPASSSNPTDLPMPDFNAPERQIDGDSSLQWLTDVSKAAQQLTQLTLESSAQAAFITRQNELWAYAGQLSREAAQELTVSIQRYWDTEGESDLLRFVRLQATDAQHMLYVRKLSAKMTLALVFDAETPFSTIRTQAGKLVKNLFESAGREAGTISSPANSPEVATPGYEQFENSDYQGVPLISELLGEVPPPIPLRPALKLSLPWDQDENSPAQSTEVADVPQNMPTQPAIMPEVVNSAHDTQVGSLPETSTQTNPESTSVGLRDGQKRPMPALDETFASNLSTLSADTQLSSSHMDIPEDLQVTRKQNAHVDPQSFMETRAQTVGESTPEGAHRILLEPPSLSQVNLTYACLLIPRFEHHHLIGDVAVRLNEWVPQLCVAFGWRLEFMSVRPEYLQWIARVPLNTAAGYVIRIIRQHTSDRFFTEFPRFKIDNPSGEFWAPGFIVQGGSQTHPPKQVREFIKQTRIRQGVR